MSGIILSASVRQNLLSLQSTADLLATTQSHLSTGKKVKSALDNPTNYFTAASLDNRASDINNLLDGIGNGVQVLQAANTGITSLQKLVDSAKSIANQALQATSGYSTKSTATSAAITGATATNLIGDADTAATVSGTAVAAGLAATDTTTAAGFADGDSFTVNGKTITFATAGTTETAAATTDAAGNVTINLTYTAGATDSTVQDVLDAIDGITGGSSSISAGNVLTISNATTDTTNSIILGGDVGGALANLGLTAGGTKPTNSKDNQVLSIAAIGSKAAQTITIGTGTGAVNTLDDLNKKLADSNLVASLSSDGKLSITTANDDASVDLTGKITGTATGTSGLLGTLTTTTPVKDINAQNTRADLVRQYNTVIDQIKTTAQDASFNGINLLNGDQLKLVFNETGKSTLTINGVTDDPAGLGLASLTAGTDFIDNDSTQKVLTALNDASSTLRSQASAFGSNLSIVQIRQDFSKNLINVLQTGSSNLTLADTNEEAANSQALSTRQSI
ncbi:flagellin N-terminal helical domain-containing protein, partial [Bradyrhizobium cenepequi]|uniref:flagellin N-terminal helical domain-containing protein n=1 Tax=Bradyrhizobium cenepequi TaxID=2821403 RepID=UPI001CE31812